MSWFYIQTYTHKNHQILVMSMDVNCDEPNNTIVEVLVKASSNTIVSEGLPPCVTTRLFVETD